MDQKLLLFALAAFFFSILSHPLYSPGYIKHKLLDSASSRLVSKGRRSRFGKLGKSLYEAGVSEAGEEGSLRAHQITTLHRRDGKKTHSHTHTHARPPGMHSTSHNHEIRRY